MTMRTGQTHNWAQHIRVREKKVAPGVWNYGYVGYKRQKAYPGIGRGSQFVWRHNGIQRAYKTKNGKYLITYKGKKRLIKAKVRK